MFLVSAFDILLYSFNLKFINYEKTFHIKLNSIKNKIIFTVAVCSFMACAFIGSISIYKSSTIIKDYADTKLLLTVKNKSFEVNNMLSKIETVATDLQQELERDIEEMSAITEGLQNLSQDLNSIVNKFKL